MKAQTQVLKPFLTLTVLTILALAPQSQAKVDPLRVAVLDVAPASAESGFLSEAAGSHLSLVLTRLKRFKVLERSALQKVLKEQSMGDTGLMDDATAAKVGKLAGVQQMLLGKISQADIRKEPTETKSVNDKGVTIIQAWWTVSGQIGLSYRFVDVETGEITAQGSRTRAFSTRFAREAAVKGAPPTLTQTPVPGESESIKMMRMMMEHQEEMERIKAGISGPKSSAPEATPTPRPSLWTDHSDLAQGTLDSLVGDLGNELYNDFPLTGKVVSIQDAKHRLCVIDLGAAIGLRKGDDFAFLDGKGLRIGKMEVKELGDTASVCKFQKDERVISGIKIRALPR